MRLIDIEAEMLKKNLEISKYEGGLSAKRAIRLFMNQPTVVAIPIEYLFKELKQCKASTVVEVGAIIDKWVKENEKNNI